MIKAILFDFGGVLAEEGFKNGLQAIARRQGLDPDHFFALARDLVYSTGYVTGQADERAYWKALREEAGFETEDAELRQEILDRFILRPELIAMVQDLRKRGFVVGILSDQTDWLEELDQKYHFLRYFDPVFNSFRLHKGKNDPSLFLDVSKILGIDPEEILFVDDNSENIKRASSKGWRTILFRDPEGLKEELGNFL